MIYAVAMCRILRFFFVLWCSVVLLVISDVSEQRIAFNPEDRGDIQCQIKLLRGA